MFESLYLTRSGAWLRQITAPLVDERKRYLEFLHSQGVSLPIIRNYANAMWYFVCLSGIQSKRKVTLDEVDKVTTTYMDMGEDVKFSIPKQSVFKYRVCQWLNFSGMLEINEDEYYGKDYIESYCNYLLNIKGYSKNTVSLRIEKLKGFMLFCNRNNLELKNLCPNDIDGFINHRMGVESRRTIVQSSSILRSFLKYCGQQGWCNNNIWSLVKAPRTYKNENIPSYIDWQHVVNIVKRLSEREDRTSIRDYAIFLLFVVYGLRDSEVRNLRLSDIDWVHDTISVSRAKNYRTQLLPLVPSVGNAILRYIREVRPNDIPNEEVFLRVKAPIKPLGTLYDIVNQYLKEEGIDIKHYGPHSLRHSCATVLINNGHSYKLVADLLGHQQYDTVTVYAKVDFKNLRKVAEMDWEGLL